MFTPEFTQAAIGGALFSLSLTFSFGPRTMCLIRSGITGSRPVATASAAYISEFLLVGAGIGGLASLMASKPGLIIWLQVAGVAALCWFGVRQLSSLRRNASCVGVAASHDMPRSAVREILYKTWFNPLAYIEGTFLVGVLAAGYGSLASIGFGIGYLLAASLRFYGWSLLGWKLSRWLGRPSILRGFDVISATFAFGIATLLAVDLAAGA